MTETQQQQPAFSQRTWMIVIAVAAFTVMAAGIAVGVNRQPANNASQPPAQAITMPDLTLTNVDGQAYNLLERSQGKITLLYLGYLNCPDACPITSAVLSQTMAAMPADVRAAVQIVFVSVDTQRDTPADIREYLDRYDRTFIGLSATDDQLESLQIALNAPVAVAETADNDGDYLVGHVTSVFAFNRSGTSDHSYPLGTRQADWTRILREMVNE